MIDFGALALVGSGEYTAAMDTTDRDLLATLGDPALWQVALLPTASARESGRPAYWNALGAAHFGALGAQTYGAHLLTRADAEDATLLAALAQQTFYYFSGGNPVDAVATLTDTSAWRLIRERHRAGAVLAGCSGGAMMLGEWTLNVTGLRSGHGPRWIPGLGMLPGIAIIPHFDRIFEWMPATYERLIEELPAGVWLLGIDEDTALVRHYEDSVPIWRASGRQRVVVRSPDGTEHSYTTGERVPLADG